MGSRVPVSAAVSAVLVVLALAVLAPGAPAQPLNPSNPPDPVKLVFVHHSTGENWLRDDDGGLGLALRDANYFVSDTNYGWGPEDVDSGGGSIGDHTDVGHFYSWFAGPHRDTYLTALYAHSDQSSSYSRLGTDPGGANRVVLFKSCFPNSHLQGSLTDPVPPIGSNPLRHQDSGSEHHTFANAKGIYESLLTYFATRQDRLFVLVTSPPLTEASTGPEAAALARALNDWLVTGWLAGYPHHNVFVFDFYNVLTSNGGATRTDDPWTNDLGWDDGNHHRHRDGLVDHLMTVSNGFSAYGSSEYDSHPSQAGNLKATGEVVSLLNVAWHCWQGTGGCPTAARPAAASRYHPLPPCRVVDTRLAAGALAGPPLVAGADRDFPVATSPCGIPATAKAVSLNVTAVEASAGGDLIVYPGDLHDPGPASSIAFRAGLTRAVQSVAGLAADGTGTVRIRNRAPAPVDVVLDVNGYFE